MGLKSGWKENINIENRGNVNFLFISGTLFLDEKMKRNNCEK